VPLLLKLVLAWVVLYIVVLALPFAWWRVRPTRQTDTLIGRWLGGFLDVSLRNLAIRTLALAMFAGVGLYAILMGVLFALPVFATVFLVIHLVLRLFSRTYEPPMHTPGIIVITVLMWVTAVGLLAPLKAVLMGAYFAMGQPAGGLLEVVTVGRDNEGLDAIVGAAGVTVVVVWLARDLLWRHRQLRQLATLPTSKARSVALGLVELKGVARPASGRGEAILTLHWDMYDYLHPKQELRPFYLEDETGRVLVDPTGCRIRAGWIADLASAFGCREVVLTRRVHKEDRDDAVTRTLMPGDPVYVLGTAEINREAPASAVDSERLVIRPSKLSHWSLSLWRFLFASMEAPAGRTGFNVFFLSDGGELRARRAILRGLRTVWIAGCVWLAASLFLLWCANAPFQPNPESWRTAHWTRSPDDSERLRRLDRYVKSLGPTSVEAAPALIEALGYENVRFRELAARGLGRILPAAREQAREAIPHLRDLLRASDGMSQTAINTLSGFGPVAEPVVPDLAALLRHRDVIIRYQAARALGRLGPTARAAVPALREALEDRSLGVRNAARDALRRIER